MKTIQEFIQDHDIRMTTEQVDSRTDGVDWQWEARHYVCSFNDGAYCVQYSMGIGLTEEPTAEGVLSCLASDSALIENVENFEEFCSELGFDDDSIRELRGYELTVKQRDNLKRFLGEEAYQELLWNVERE